MPPLVVVKVGGSVLTYKKEKKIEINQKLLDSICGEISEAFTDFPLIFVHGTGSYGHIYAQRFALLKGASKERQKRGAVVTRVSVQSLNTKIIQNLWNFNIPAIPAPPASIMSAKEGRIDNANLRPILRMLSDGFLPVLYGDLVLDSKYDMSIISSDQIACYLSEKLNVTRLVMGTDVDGVFIVDPKSGKYGDLVEVINSENYIEILNQLKSGSDATKAMKGKIEELLMLSKRGSKAIIVNATKKRLGDAIKGKKVIGTIVSN